MLNLCANNYLGLASHPEIVRAAHEALDRWGYGLSSVRFICGTQQIHKQLERRLSEFLGTEDTILYGSCFDANGGLFETLLEAEDAVISDELNHASIIDGIRLSKAQRFRYRNGDMADLEAKLREAAGARRMLIATDGVFSMDGYIARLPEICDLGGALRGDGDGGRFARRRIYGEERPRHARASRRRGAHRYPHGYARQSAGRGERRLYQRAARDHRAAAAALAAVPVFEHGGAGDCGGFAGGARPADAELRAA